MSYPGGESDWGMELATHLDLVPRLGVRGAIPPLCQCIIMAWCLFKQEMCLCVAWYLVKHSDNFTLPFYLCKHRIDSSVLHKVMFTMYFVYEFIHLHFGVQFSIMSCNVFV